MRVTSGLLGAVMAALLLVSCGGASPKETASRAAGSIASIAEPRKALAASAELLAKESFALQYSGEFEESEGPSLGTFRFARDGKSSLFSFDGDMAGEQFTLSFITRDEKSYVCVKGTAWSDLEDGGCVETPVDDSDNPDEIDFAMFFDMAAMLKDMTEDEDAKIEDAPDQTINGVPSRCFTVTADDGAGTICIATDDGRLVQIKGDFDGMQGEITLVASRKPQASDFELPFPLVDEDELWGGLFGGAATGGGAAAGDEPEPPSKPGLAGVRILGEPFPWEGPAACPGAESFGVEEFAVDAAGSIYFPDVESIRKVGADCTVTELPGPDEWLHLFAVAPGNVFYATRVSGSDQGVVLRIEANGKAVVVAGKECPADDSKDCPVPEDPSDGPATANYLGSIRSMAVAPDGTVWFVEQPWVEDKVLDSRLRKLSPDGRLTTLPASTFGKTGLPSEVALDGQGNAWIGYGFDSLLRLATDGTVKRFESGGGGCLAVDASGSAWTYDMIEGELLVTRADGSQARHAYAPAEGTYCWTMAFLPSGELLFASFDGLWRVDVP